MELRSKDNDMGVPSSFSYKLNKCSSSKVSSSSPPINSAVGERIRDQTIQGDSTILNPNSSQTLVHHHLYQPELNPHHQLFKPRRDPDPRLEPVSVPVGTNTSATISATANRSSLQDQPPTSQLSPVSGSTSTIRYRECLKNHAASMGGLVVDGCGEFMPNGEEGTPEALKCAACECHRNFHRKEINGELQYAPSCYYTHNLNKNNTRRDTASPSQLHHQRKFSLGLSTSIPTMPIAPVMMNFGGCTGGGPVESSSEDLNMFNSTAGRQSSYPESSRKRFRTKFSQEQKDKMMEFAETLGWRIQEQDEQDVQQFCSQVGVKRKVFKVWLHNNKQAMKKKQM